MTTDEGTPTKPDGLTKTLLFLFIGLPVLFFGGCAVLVAVGSSGSDDDEVSDFEVRRQCERWVEERLKAPATAEFVDGTVTGGPTEWTVTGAVDAENSFGALVRTDWSCDIRLDGDTWRGGVDLSD